MKLGKYMTARAVGTAPHETYMIMSSRGDMLGVIEWYPRWRQYVFDPGEGVFSHDCMRELAAFCERLGKEPRTERASDG